MLADYSETSRPTRIKSTIIENHYLGQKEGEHVGLGDPPSANEAIDVPKVNRMAATTKRVNFFISVSPFEFGVATCWGNTTSVLRKRNTCSKSARFRSRANTDA